MLAGRQFPSSAPRRSRLPSGLCPGQSCAASRSLTIATGAARSSSRSSNNLPSISGTRNVAK